MAQVVGHGAGVRLRRGVAEAVALLGEDELWREDEQQSPRVAREHRHWRGTRRRRRRSVATEVATRPERGLPWGVEGRGKGGALHLMMKKAMGVS